MVTEDDIISRYGRSYFANDIIFKEGDVGEEMFIIHKGKVRITKKTEDGEKTLVELGTGDFFGEMAVIDHDVRSASAVAAEDTVCIALNEELFEQQMQRNSKIVKKILKNMSSRLRAANDSIKNLTIKDHNMRVINTLLLQAHKYGENTPFKYAETLSAAGMEENKAKFDDIMVNAEKAKIITIDRNNATVTVPSKDKTEQYRQFLEMKKAFGEG